MLLSLTRILELAQAGNMAVGAFNVTTMEGILAVLEAAKREQVPVILQFANAAHKGYIALEEIGPVMLALADKSPLPVCVHLDHGESLEEVDRALRLGFTWVMYDGSALEYALNVANTKAVVEMAKKYGAGVEAEIGAMGREDGNQEGGGVALASSYTDPGLAQSFIRDTGADALACSFGTVHGIYASEPKLDFERILEIRRLTGVPVVMHGGSGVSEKDFRHCISNGVRKINFYTYAAKYAGEAVAQRIQDSHGNIYFHDIALWGRQSMAATYEDAMRVFKNQ